MPHTMLPRLHNQQGVTYLMLMFAIVLIGLSMTAAAKQWKTMVQRELEADLMSKGIEIQNALALYSATMKAGRVTPGGSVSSILGRLDKTAEAVSAQGLYRSDGASGLGILAWSDRRHYGRPKQQPREASEKITIFLKW